MAVGGYQEMLTDVEETVVIRIDSGGEDGPKSSYISNSLFDAHRIMINASTQTSFFLSS